MISHHKLDKAFGPSGSFAGVVILTIGILMAYFEPLSIILVPFGAFMAFTCSSTRLDMNQKRIKFSNDLFGFITTGRWIRIEPGMKIGLQKSNHSWRSYSRSNRPLDVQEKDYRILLFDAYNRKIMPVKKFASLTDAKKELKAFATQLNLSML